MAHNVIEVDAFTTPIVVPDGADSRNNAAEVVQALTQGLTNRTKHLNDHVAFRDSPNTFTAINAFNALVQIFQNIESQSLAADVGAFVVRTTPADDPHAGNKYKAIFGANIGAYYVNIYSGIATGSDGQLLITINAVWDIVNQRWFKDSTGVAAYALIFDIPSATATFSVRTGTSTWTTWPTPSTSTLIAGSGNFGNVSATGDIVAGDDVIAADDISAGGDLGAIGNINAGGALDVTGVATAHAGVISGADYILPAGNKIKYATLHPQFRRVRIAAGISDETVNGLCVFDGTKWKSTATAYGLSVPLPELSNQTEIVAVWVRYKASGADGTVELVRQQILDWGVSPSGATPTVTVLGSAAMVAAGAGTKTITFVLGTPEAVDHQQYDYYIRITGDPGATHEIWAAALSINLFSPGID